MRHLLALLAVLWATTAHAQISDTFDRADGGLGANWTTADGTGCAIVSNQAARDAGTGLNDYTGCFYSGTTWNTTQSSEATRAGANPYVAVAVRMEAGGNWYAYFSHGDVQKAISGTVTTGLATWGTYTAGDVVRLVATNNVLEGFINGVSQGTITDNSLSNGSPGLMFYNADATGVLLDSWTGTGETGGAGVTTRRLMTLGVGDGWRD